MVSRTAPNALAVFALTVAFFGSSFPAIKAAEESFSPVSIVLLRAVLATGALALLATALRVSLRMPLRDLMISAAIGQLGISLFQLILNSAIALTSVGVASTLVNTAPLISLGLSAILLRERIPLLRWVGVFISIGGIFLLGTSTGVTDSLGVGLLLIAALSLGTYSVLLKPLLQRQNPLAVTFHGTWPGIFLFAWAVPSVTREAPGATTSAWLGVAVLVIFVTCGGYVLLARLLQLLPVSRVVLYYYLVPPVAIVYSMILFRELPSAREVVGVIVVIAGVALAMSARVPQAKSPEAR
jgi:drug/metabolite transporter (DMT)-like permease